MIIIIHHSCVYPHDIKPTADSATVYPLTHPLSVCFFTPLIRFLVKVEAIWSASSIYFPYFLATRKSQRSLFLPALHQRDRCDVIGFPWKREWESTTQLTAKKSLRSCAVVDGWVVETVIPKKKKRGFITTAKKNIPFLILFFSLWAPFSKNPWSNQIT